MFFWNTPMGRKIFRTDPDFASKSKVLAANQGLYNFFLAAGLFASLLLEEMAAHWFRFFFLSCVIIAGVFGAATASKSIFFLQAVPALVGFFFVILRI
jgi:putative membrane protein